MYSHLTLIAGFIFTLYFLVSPTISVVVHPIWPQRFTQDYIFNYNGGSFPGKIWYDFPNKRQRIDFKNFTLNDVHCYLLAKTGNTPCTRVNINSTSYIRLPEKNICCKCCKEDIGRTCGRLQLDWLNDYDYVGQTYLDGTIYNQWKESNYNFSYYATIGQKQIPRRIQQHAYQYTDYIINSFSEEPIDEKIFDLPIQCQRSCPVSAQCPASSSQQYFENQLLPQIKDKNLKIQKREQQILLQK